MRCLICKEEFSDDVINCPNCGRKLVDDDLDIELPQLKDGPVLEDGNGLLEQPKFDDIDMEKTIMIKSIDEEAVSLEDAISKQIEEINEEANVANAIDEVDIDEENVDEVNRDEDIKEEVDEELKLRKYEEYVDLGDTLAAPSSVKMRKNVFFVVGIGAIFLLAFVVMILAIITNKTESVKNEDYMESLTKALEVYYYGDGIDDVIYVLEDIKNDEEKVLEAQLKAKTTCESWVLLFLEEEIDNKDKLEVTTSRYKELINGLYRYAIVSNDDGVQIRLLVEDDYDAITKEFDDVYSDSYDFFEALEYYNKKDYNKAYYLYERIDKNNSYYEKCITYKNKIVDEIITLLNKDIANLEADIDTLSNDAILERYTQIENIILEYNNVYEAIDLSEKEVYQEVLTKYTSKVSEYTDIVVNGSN